ncbi:MAG: hypothetical protein ABIB04_03810 [Patescibacteria group bacterium]
MLYKMKLDPARRYYLSKIEKEASYFDLSYSMSRPLGLESEVFAPRLDPRLTIRKLKPGDLIIFCTDGVIDKYEKEIDYIPTPEDMTTEQLDLKTFIEDMTDGYTLTERLNNLRIHAGFRRNKYKQEDDGAIVGVKLPDVF